VAQPNETKFKKDAMAMSNDLIPNRTGYPPEIKFDKLVIVSRCAPALSGLIPSVFNLVRFKPFSGGSTEKKMETVTL
jgi:hypothetical protein